MSTTTAMLVDTIGFRVPCRSFHVRAYITRDRPLPVVNEFVLRLLRICEQLTLDRLGAFFGFTRSETERVVQELVAQDLLIAEKDELRLSTTAAALFRASADEEPRLVEVEAWTENVWIELVGHSFVPRPRQRAHRNLLDVDPSTEAVGLPREFARTAFQENFRDYVTRVRRLREPDRVNIHSIPAVEPDRWGSVVLTGRKMIDVGDRSPRLEFEGASDAPLQFRTMIEGMSTSYGRLNQPRAQETSIADFERLSGVSIRAFFDDTQVFNLEKWLIGRTHFGDSTRGWVLGASYLTSQIGDIVERLRAKPPDQVKPELRWLRPSGDLWGMTTDLGSAMEILRRAVGLPDVPRMTGATLLTPNATASISQKRLSRLFERGQMAPPKLGSSLEIVIAGRAVALLLVHVFVDARETIPVGIVTDHPTLVARLDAQIRDEKEAIWTTKPRRRESYRDDQGGPAPDRSDE